MKYRADALNLDGGPVYAGAMGSPVTGSCTVVAPTMTTGEPCHDGGATVTCTGLNPATFQNLYLGIRNDVEVIGHAINDLGPAAGVNQFTLMNTSTTSISYGATSTVTNAQTSMTENVTSELLISFEAGTGSLVATDGFPASSPANGDIEHLWKVNATDLNVTVEIFALSDTFTTLAASCPNITDPILQPFNHFDRSNIDLAFYYENSCDPTPRMGCASPGKSILKIKNSGVPLKNKVSWKWLKGTVVSPSEFGTPLASTSYRLCFYDGNTLLTSPRPHVGAVTNWADAGSGFKYKNSAGNEKGVSKVALKSGASGKAKIQLLARGPANTLPSLPMGLTTDLRVQLTKDTASGPECWESLFPLASIDDGDKQLKARLP